jgi:hypothetical protein
MIHHIQTKSYSTSIAITIVLLQKSGHLTELPQLIDVGIDAIYFAGRFCSM